MTTDKNIQINNYFDIRGVDKDYYQNYIMPKYLLEVLPTNKDAEIIDIGCGFGQFLLKLREIGYTNIKGIDISNESVDYCKSKGLNVIKINNIADYESHNFPKNDFAIMSHVLEHIDKNVMIDTVKIIKNTILKPSGKYCVMVPNAQSNTAAYWMYEDFTHTWLFTAGSLLYVLRSAGFKTIDFLDADGTSNSNFFIKIIKTLLLVFYKLNKSLWNKITGSSYHKPSPIIHTWELKALASA